MDFAIIEDGGKQYQISEGQTLKIEKLSGDHKEGDTVTFDKVLLISDSKGVRVGSPYVEGASVTASFVRDDRNSKVVVTRYKAKSRYHKKRGHRQPVSVVSVGKAKV